VTFSNIFAAICFTVAFGLAAYGINKIFESLPGVTPRHINDAPGRSRLANRNEMRRSRIL
jgi:hypothetical protein